MSTINIEIDGQRFTAELADTPSVEALLAALPISFTGTTWGEEIYGGIPMQADEEADARDIMEVGAIAYWPPGQAFCIFYGPTPASHADEPRAASPVNVLGLINEDVSTLSSKSGAVSVRLSQ